MAKPILRIKQGNAKPGNYSVITGLGLTAGELGANLIAGSYGFYIGNTFGQAITFGCEVTTDSAFTTPSDAKIPTQKALKTYVDALSVSASPSGIISRYSSGDLAVSANIPISLTFANSELQTILDTHLTYTSTGTNNGRFTNNSGNIMYLLVTYQITWVVPSVSVPLNSNPAKSVWIQKTFLLNDAPANNVYGFTSLLIQTALNNNAGAITGTQNGSAIIALEDGQYFTIQCRSPVATSITDTASVNLGTFTTNFNKATRIQIVRL